MKKNILVVEATGGLANRMQAISGAVKFASDYKIDKIKILWFNKSNCRCSFDDLFDRSALPENVKMVNFHLLPGFYDLVWKKFILKLYTKGFEYKSLRNNYDLEAKIRGLVAKAPGSSVFIRTGHEFSEVPGDLKIFKLSKKVQALLEEATKDFSANTIGVHIRRTDSTESIAKSPSELFYEIMDREIAADPEVKFYIASDNDEEKRLMRERYGDRTIMSFKEARRDTLEGMLDATVEMYTLAGTRRIIGSFWSSYSEMASRIGGIELERATRETGDGKYSV